MKNKIRVALATAFVSLFGASVVVSHPTAALADSCPSSGYLCLYNDSAHTDLMEFTAASLYAPGACYSLGSSNNKTSYIKNTSSSQFAVYDSGNCSGYPGTIYAHSAGAMSAEWNNDISSLIRIG